MILSNILFSLLLESSGAKPTSNRPQVHPARLSRGSDFLKCQIGRVSSKVLKPCQRIALCGTFPWAAGKPKSTGKDGSAKARGLEGRRGDTKRLLFKLLCPKKKKHFQLFADILPLPPGTWEYHLSQSIVLLKPNYSNPIFYFLSKLAQKGQFKVHAKQELKGVCVYVSVWQNMHL